MDKIHYYGGMFFCPDGMECSNCYAKRTCEMSDYKDDNKPSPRVEYVPISAHQNTADHVKAEKVGELKCRI